MQQSKKKISSSAMAIPTKRTVHCTMALILLIIGPVAAQYEYTGPVENAKHGAGSHGRGRNSEAAQFMAPQNAMRAKFGEKPLVWDVRLALYAQWWANQRSYDCSLVHSNGPYGENIFWGSGSDWTPEQAVESWTQEQDAYDYTSNSCSGMCGHYTQVVWKGTRRIGCARVVCFGGAGVFMTCNYDPPGNYMGEKPY